MRFVFRNLAGETGRPRPAHHLADVDLIFDEEPLAGLRIVGSSVWARKNGTPGMSVMFPSKPIDNGPEPAYFHFFQNVDRAARRVQFLRDQILTAFVQAHPELAAAAAAGILQDAPSAAGPDAAAG